MNVHHLEIFYHVARHHGISAAVGKMPFSVQQPAISSQLKHLEDELATPLFVRRPFSLTDAGRTLFVAISPFFGQLDALKDEIRGLSCDRLRVGATGVIFSTYLLPLLEALRQTFPDFRLSMRDGTGAALAEGVMTGELDVAITSHGETSVRGINCRSLVSLPLQLIVPREWANEPWNELLATKQIVSLPKTEPLVNTFATEMDRRGLPWDPGVEVHQINAVDAFVERGFGIGLSVAVPRLPKKERGIGKGDPLSGLADDLPETLAAVELPGFPQVSVNLLTTGTSERRPVVKAFIEGIGVLQTRLGLKQ